MNHRPREKSLVLTEGGKDNCRAPYKTVFNNINMQVERGTRKEWSGAGGGNLACFA